MVAARLLVAIVHSCAAIKGNEASHNCHKNIRVTELHVLSESVLLNAERERYRKDWQICKHLDASTNCSPLTG